MHADLQLRGITPRTQKDYLREVSNLEKYFNKSPEELGEKEVKEYLVHLLKDGKISGGTYRYYVSGIKFLYRTSLHHVRLLLGHRPPTTTTVYLHVSKVNLAEVTSPLDRAPRIS